MTVPTTTNKSTIPEIVQVNLQSAAFFSILEQYQRRNENSPSRLLGVILGSVAPLKVEEGSVSLQADIRHCYPVPHSEVAEQVSINSELLHTRLDLHRKCYSRDSALLGWYAIRFEANVNAAHSSAKQAVDDAAYARNTDFIRDYFVREVATAGAPMAINLSILIGKDGQLSVSAQGFSAKGTSSPIAIPVKNAFGVPEAFCLESVRRSLISETPERTSEGQILLSLASRSSFRAEDKKQLDSLLILLQQYLADVHAGKRVEDKELTALIRTIFSNLGLDPQTGNPTEVTQSLEKNLQALAEVSALLQKQSSLVAQALFK